MKNRFLYYNVVAKNYMLSIRKKLVLLQIVKNVIMKRAFLSIILIISALLVVAQKNSPMRAYNLYYDQDNAKAKECIDECIQDEKFSTKANTWLYKANIEYRLASADYTARQQNKDYKPQFPTAAKDAYLAFKKAQELNKNIEATDMFAPYQALPVLYPVLFIEGVDDIMAKNYEEARSVLALAVESYEMQQPQYPLNGELYYYYAYVFSMLNDDANAQKYYQKAIDDGSENVNVYVGLIDSYKNANRKDDVFSLISKGLQKEPNNNFLRVAEADYYYWINQPEVGRTKLQSLPASVATSPESAINAANLMIRDSMYTEAEALLSKAYRNSPDNSVIAHNLGVCYSNIGEYKFLEAEKIKLHGDKNVYQNLKNESTTYLKRAADYFEISLRGNPDDTRVMQRLQQLYLRTGQDEKAAEIEKKMNK